MSLTNGEIDAEGRVLIEREQEWRNAIRSEESRNPVVHDCLNLNPRWQEVFDRRSLGSHDDWDISHYRCRTCARAYLHILLEDDGMPRSGRYFVRRIPGDADVGLVALGDFLPIMAQSERVYFGGSYWASEGCWSRVTNVLRDLHRFRVVPEDPART